MNLINWLGIGTVAATKQTSSKEIMVHMPSLFSTADGRTLAQTEHKQETSFDANGREVTSNTLVSNTVPAVWNSFGEANRLTPPDVREGSRVALYHVPGQNTLYWTTNGMNAETMRMETVIWGFSANPNLDADAPFSMDDYYMMKVSTHDGLFELRTSQANGEKTAWNLQMNGMAGRFDLRGTNESIFSMDDPESKFTYVNKEKSIFGVNKKKMLMSTEDSIGLNSKEAINILTKVFSLQCKDINIKADTAKIAIGKTDWEGDIDLVGNVKQEGNTKQTGNYDQTGNFKSTGIVQGLTAVRTAIVDLNTHVHGGVMNGFGSTNAPTPVPQAAAMAVQAALGNDSN